MVGLIGDAAVAAVGPQLVTLGGRGFGETKVASEELVWRRLPALGLLVSMAAGETHPGQCCSMSVHLLPT